MTTYRCKSCEGEYTPDQRGGYFHVCPVYRLVKVGPGGVGIEPGDPGPYTDVTKLPNYRVLKDQRDENIDDTDMDKPKPVKKEGKGREVVSTETPLPT